MGYASFVWLVNVKGNILARKKKVTEAFSRLDFQPQCHHCCNKMPKTVPMVAQRNNPDDVYMIADTDNGLLIRENNYNYPVLVYDVTRSDIDNNPQEAKVLREEAMPE